MRRAIPRVLIGLAVFCGQGASADETVRTVMLLGMPAPGAVEGSIFVGNAAVQPVYKALLNDHGHVAFRGSAQSKGSYSGYWAENSSGELSLVALSGTPSPAPGVDFTFLDPTHQFSNRGELAFGAHVAGPGVPAGGMRAIFSGSAGNLQMLALEGAPAPGTDWNFSNTYLMNGAPVSDRGQTVFRALADVPEMGIWYEDQGNVELLAAYGQPAPGFSGGVTHGTMTHPMINQLGLAGFSGGVNPGNDTGVWTGRPGELQLVTASGQAAPGVVGAQLASVGLRGLTDIGAAIVGATLAGAGVDEANNSILYSMTTSMATIVAREGMPAPGLPDGVTFAHLSGTTQTNAQGDVALLNSVLGPGVNGTNSSALWIGQPEGLSLVVREGDQAAGMPEGAVYDLDRFEINDRGQVAFNSGGSAAGIWAVDRLGETRLIVGEGSIIEVAPGDARGVVWTSLGQINSRGQVSFTAIFSDNTQGVFVSDLVALPLGDANADGLVTGADFTIWADNFSLSDGDQTWQQGDWSGDGLVTGADFTIWADHFGMSDANARAVPEPTTGGLALVALLALVGAAPLARRR